MHYMDEFQTEGMELTPSAHQVSNIEPNHYHSQHQLALNLRPNFLKILHKTKAVMMLY